jgi:hypothetical protein
VVRLLLHGSVFAIFHTAFPSLCVYMVQSCQQAHLELT